MTSIHERDGCQQSLHHVALDSYRYLQRNRCNLRLGHSR